MIALRLYRRATLSARATDTIRSALVPPSRGRAGRKVSQWSRRFETFVRRTARAKRHTPNAQGPLMSHAERIAFIHFSPRGKAWGPFKQ